MAELTPTIVATKTVRNPTAATVQDTITLKETRSTSETTTWAESFGTQSQFQGGAEINIFDFSTTLTISHDSTFGQQNTVDKSEEVTKGLSLIQLRS